jgi:hypothetical protein
MLSSVSVSPLSYDLLVGEELTMQAQAFGFDCGPLVCVPGGPVAATFVWNSNSPTVAAITAKGVLLGLRPGEVNVTASVQTQATGTITGYARVRIAYSFMP